MAMKKCKECGAEISSSAKVCPNCGKKQKLSGCLIAFIVVILLGIILGASGDNSTSQNTSKTTLSEGNTVETSSTQTENNTVAEAKTKYSVGEIFENDYIAVKYVSVDDNFKGYSKYAEIKSGYKVIKASFEFENVSTTDQLASSWDFKCYSDGYDCESFYYVDDSSFSADLSVGKKTTGNVYFQVPANATEITIEYEADYWSNKKVEFVVK